jgi:hypothetical protein
MLKNLLLAAMFTPFQLAFAGSSERGVDKAIADVCSISASDDDKELVVSSLLRTDMLHGTFLGDSRCPYKLRVIVLSDNREPGVRKFVDDLGKRRGINMSWQTYQGKFSGVVRKDEKGSLNYHLTRVYWYKEGRP